VNGLYSSGVVHSNNIETTKQHIFSYLYTQDMLRNDNDFVGFLKQ